MPDPALVHERANGWIHFVNGDLEKVRERLAPDALRIGPRACGADSRQCGRDVYIEYMRALHKTMRRLRESVAHDASPDSRPSYINFTELDSAKLIRQKNSFQSVRHRIQIQ